MDNLSTVFSIALQIMGFVLLIKYLFFPEKNYRFYRIELKNKVVYVRTSKELSLDIFKTLSLKGSCVIDKLDIKKIDEEDDIIRLL